MALSQELFKMCPALHIKSLFAIIVESNVGSITVIERLGFEKWGFMPRISDYDGKELGHVYYGIRLTE